MRRAILEQEVESEALQRHLMWAALKIPPGEPSPSCAARNLMAYCRFARVRVKAQDADALQILALEAMPSQRAVDGSAARTKRRGRPVTFAAAAVVSAALVTAGAAWFIKGNRAPEPPAIAEKAPETAPAPAPTPLPGTPSAPPATTVPTDVSTAAPAPEPAAPASNPAPVPEPTSAASPPGPIAPELIPVTAPPVATAEPPQPLPTPAKPIPTAPASAAATAPSAGQIAEAQRLLRSLGYDPGVANGKITAKTSGAVKAFAKTEGISATGEVTIELLKALRSAWGQREATAKEHFAAGLRALDAKHYDEAVKELKAGVALEDRAEAQFHLGEAYQALGNTKAAGEAYRRSISLDPKSGVAAKAKNALEEMRAAEAKAAQPPAASETRSPTVPAAAANSPQGAWLLQYSKLFSSGGGSSKIKENLTISGNTASAVAEVSSQITDKSRKVRGCPDGTYSLSYTLEATYNVEPVSSGSALVLRSVGPLVLRNVSPSCFTMAPPEHQDEVLRWDGSSLFGENGRYQRLH
jgi:peptidoglycan hydrolase-like protein with peptidoglycan-binding domain